MSISWWKTGVMLPDMGGTIHTQSAGQPPRQRYSFSMCLMKDSVAEWWSTMVTLSLWWRARGKVIRKISWGVQGGGIPVHGAAFPGDCKKVNSQEVVVFVFSFLFLLYSNRTESLGLAFLVYLIS